MQNKPFRMGPAALATSVANILNPGTTTGGVLNGATFTTGSYQKLYIIITHIRIVNTTTGSLSASLFIGSSASSTSGTEFMVSASPIPSQTSGSNWLDWYGRVRLDTTDYLTGFGSGSGLTIEAEGEIGIA